MLEGRLGDLHSPGTTYRWMGYIAIAPDLVAGVHNDDTLCLGEYACRFTEHRCFANPRRTENQHTLARFNDVAYDVDCAINGASNAAGQADDVASAVAKHSNTVQSLFQTWTVILIQNPYFFDEALQ